MIVRLQRIEAGELRVGDQDWRTTSGVLWRMLHYATRCTDASVDAFLREFEHTQASDARFTESAKGTARDSATKSSSADASPAQAAQEIATLKAAQPSIRLPSDWADAANSAKGLCESEANKWEKASPATSEHWRSVATRLGALYLSQDHVVVAHAAEQAQGALRALLLRIRGWDMLDAAVDGQFWKHEIDALLRPPVEQEPRS